MKSKQRTGLCAVLGALACAVYTSPAAAAASDYVTVILDQTGSMTDTSGGTMRWINAVNKAREVLTDAAYANSTTTGYGIWTFKQGAGQDGTAQVWPLNQAECGGSMGYESITSPATGRTSNYCVPLRSSAYDYMLGRFDEVASGVMWNSATVPFSRLAPVTSGVPSARLAQVRSTMSAVGSARR